MFLYPTREEAIRNIVFRYGERAVYIFSTGYICRTGYKVCSELGCTGFYMQGSMGLAPAIGLGIAEISSIPVVVISGDGALLMSLGIIATKWAYNPLMFHVYVLDNCGYESVGGQDRVQMFGELRNAIKKVMTVMSISSSPKDERVGISPEENAQQVKEFLRVKK